MTTIRPSECPISGRDAVDLMIESLYEIMRRPMWMMRTALFPFVVVWGTDLLYAIFPFGDLDAGAFGLVARWTIDAAAYVPCALAWCRIGYLGEEKAPSVLELTGIGRGLDVVAIFMAALALLGRLMTFGLERIGDPDLLDLAMHGGLRLAGGMLLVPALILGGMKLLVAAAAAAAETELSYADVRMLTARRGGWLAGIGLAFLCLYPLVGLSVEALRNLVGGPLGGIRGVWAGIDFYLVLVLVGMSGLSLGRILRRLLSGMPRDPDAPPAPVF